MACAGLCRALAQASVGQFSLAIGCAKVRRWRGLGWLRKAIVCRRLCRRSCLMQCLLPLDLAVTVLFIMQPWGAKDLAKADCKLQLHSSSCAGRGRAPFYPLYFLPEMQRRRAHATPPLTALESNPSQAQLA
jgi:hypothetical protein